MRPAAQQHAGRVRRRCRRARRRAPRRGARCANGQSRNAPAAPGSARPEPEPRRRERARTREQRRAAASVNGPSATAASASSDDLEFASPPSRATGRAAAHCAQLARARRVGIDGDVLPGRPRRRARASVGRSDGGGEVPDLRRSCWPSSLDDRVEPRAALQRQLHLDRDPLASRCRARASGRCGRGLGRGRATSCASARSHVQSPRRSSRSSSSRTSVTASMCAGQRRVRPPGPIGRAGDADALPRSARERTGRRR